MFDLAVRGTLLLAGAFLVVALLRRAPAAARHLAWATALAGLLVLPALPVVVPSWRVAVPAVGLPRLPSVGFSAEMTVDARDGSVLASDARVLPTRDETAGHTRGDHVRRTRSAAPGVVVTSVDAQPSAVTVLSDGIGAGFWWALWGAGAVIVMARLGLGMLRLRATVRGTRPIDDPAWTALVREIARRFGVRRPIALYRGSAGVVPVTSGIVRPLIIMPADADAWDDERRRLVLTHEIAHVRRFDVLTHIIGQVAVALFWFHPLAWIAAARMRLERERACDDLVLAAGVRPSRYAGDLLELAEALGGGSVPAAAALAMARRTEIEGRLLAILDGAVSRGPLGARRIASALAGAVVVICALAVVQPVTASPAAVRGREARSHERRESNDAIRRALLAAVATARTDADRRKLLFGSLGHGTRDAAMVADVVRATEAMRDDAEKSMVLRTVAGVDHLSEPVVRTAFFEATNTIKSGADRAAVLLAVLGEVRARDERRAAADSEPAVSLTIASVQTMTSKAAKVRVLREIVRAGWLTKEDVLRQFKICVLTGR